MKEGYELDVYRLSEELSDVIWFAYDTWGCKAQNTLGQQVIRAVDSSAANIAEGYGRFTPADGRRFFLYARGAFEETTCWLRKAFRRNIMSAAEVAAYKNLIDELGPKLNAFMKEARIDGVRSFKVPVSISKYD